VTATRNIHVHFSAKFHEVAGNHNARIRMGVVDQLWRHYFYPFRLINKGSLLFAVIFVLNYVMELE